MTVTPPAFTDIFTSDTSSCVGSDPFVIRLNDTLATQGNWVGNHITDSLFTPSTAGEFTIQFITQGLNSNCSGTAGVTITVVAPVLKVIGEGTRLW